MRRRSMRFSSTRALVEFYWSPLCLPDHPIIRKQLSDAAELIKVIQVSAAPACEIAVRYRVSRCAVATQSNALLASAYPRMALVWRRDWRKDSHPTNPSSSRGLVHHHSPLMGNEKDERKKERITAEKEGERENKSSARIAARQ